MENEKTKAKIFEYFDGELDAREEAKLFEELAANAELRKFFREAATLKAVTNSSRAEFPPELDDAIYDGIYSKANADEHKNANVIRSLFMYAVAAAVVLFGIFTYSQLTKYRKELDELKTIARYQNKTIEMITSGMPELQINGKPRNEIVIQSKL